MKTELHIYQSYQSGIEIFPRFSHIHISLLYQSYQSGIEMQNGQNGYFCSESINRTKVELKSVIEDHLWRYCSLSIVPKWNWNGWYGCCGLHWSHAINRTKVELKFRTAWYRSFQLLFYQSYQSGIEMFWSLTMRFPGRMSINRTKVELKSFTHVA